MDELGLGNNVYETYDDGNNVFVGSDGAVSQYDPDLAPPINEVAVGELLKILAYIT